MPTAVTGLDKATVALLHEKSPTAHLLNNKYMTQHELELSIATLIAKYDRRWTDSDCADYESFTALEAARIALRAVQDIAEIEVKILARAKTLTLRVYYDKQWTCQCQEPWQRNPNLFYLVDEQSRYIAEAETIAELITKAGDVSASWEANKEAKLSELAEIFEVPTTLGLPLGV